MILYFSYFFLPYFFFPRRFLFSWFFERWTVIFYFFPDSYIFISIFSDRQRFESRIGKKYIIPCGWAEKKKNTAPAYAIFKKPPWKIISVFRNKYLNFHVGWKPPLFGTIFIKLLQKTAHARSEIIKLVNSARGKCFLYGLCV